MFRGTKSLRRDLCTGPPLTLAVQKWRVRAAGAKRKSKSGKNVLFGFGFGLFGGKTKCRDEIGKKGFLLGLAFLCSGVSVSAFLFFPGREKQLDGSVKGEKEPGELD